MALIPSAQQYLSTTTEPWAQPGTLWPVKAGSSQFPLGIDLTEYPDRFVVHADAPGARDEDVDVTVTQGVLHVKISRQKLTERDVGFYHREERLFVERRRSIKLPENADADHAVASLKNGILSVTLPKMSGAVPKRNIPLLRK